MTVFPCHCVNLQPVTETEWAQCLCAVSLWDLSSKSNINNAVFLTSGQKHLSTPCGDVSEDNSVFGTLHSLSVTTSNVLSMCSGEMNQKMVFISGSFGSCLRLILKLLLCLFSIHVFYRWIVNAKMNNLPSFTHTHVDPNRCSLWSSVKLFHIMTIHNDAKLQKRTKGRFFCFVWVRQRH